MDPVHVAWRDVAASGKRSGQLGRCRRCGSEDQVTPLSAVVSAKFTGFDQMRAGDGLCAPCAWAFESKTRQLTMAISPHQARVLDAPALFEVLLLPVRDAVVVPITGRKHVLPYAQWGSARVDDANLAWTQADANRLRVVASLRSRGVPASTLHDPTPPWAWARRNLDLTTTTQREWDAIAPWRNTPYVALAIKATQHLKGQA